MLFGQASRDRRQHCRRTAQRKSGAVRAEQLDIVFVMGQPSERDCDVARLWSERVFVVLPDTHALCGKDAINWDDLKSEHFILTRSEIGVVVRDYVIRRLAAFHQRPDVRQSPVARDTLIHLVGLEQGSA
ncbi:MAG: hypothetical protein DLM68_10695 [Hyphomicrobiales bacterium]|nr:MAG: hypothetical protein DLM68_10695 [Hyphomicrobiales bacterium]